MTRIGIPLVCIIFYSVTILTNKDPDLIKHDVEVRLDIVREDGTLTNFGGINSVINYHDLVMYKTPLYNQTLKDSLDDKGEVVGQIMIPKDTTYKYFVFRKAEQTGKVYADVDSSAFSIFSVDSLLSVAAFKGFPFYWPDNDTLIKTVPQKMDRLKFTC